MLAAAESQTPSVVLGAGRLVVEVPRAVVGAAAVRAAVLQQVDQAEGVDQVAVPEHQVLVELDAALAVEVDVEQLAVPQRLGDRRARSSARPSARARPRGSTPTMSGWSSECDERQRVPDGRQQDVAARLVRLRLDREPDVVALVGDVAGEQVHRLAVAVRARPGRPWRCRTPRPRGRPRARRSRRPARRPGRCCAAPCAARSGAPPVVAGEAAVLEDRVGEQVGGHHRHDQPGLGQRLAEPGRSACPGRPASCRTASGRRRGR